MTLRALSIITLGLAICLAPALALAAGKPVVALCGARTGLGGRPVATSAGEAEHIFLSAERTQSRRPRPPKHSTIEVVDAGAAWAVFRWVPPVLVRRAMVSWEGGGQLELMIDKCTGAISQTDFGR